MTTHTFTFEFLTCCIPLGLALVFFGLGILILRRRIPWGWAFVFGGVFFAGILAPSMFAESIVVDDHSVTHRTGFWMVPTVKHYEFAKIDHVEIRTEIILDRPDTADTLQELFSSEKVVTVHSKEASLEDIFMRITGRGLS